MWRISPHDNLSCGYISSHDKNFPPKALPVVSVTHIRYGSYKKKIFQIAASEWARSFLVSDSRWLFLSDAIYEMYSCFVLERARIFAAISRNTLFCLDCHSFQFCWHETLPIWGYQNLPRHCSISISSFISRKEDTYNTDVLYIRCYSRMDMWGGRNKVDRRMV